MPHLISMPDMAAAEARQRMCLSFEMHAQAVAAALDAARLDQQSGAYKVMCMIGSSDVICVFVFAYLFCEGWQLC